ncbi:LysR family nod box-dependent transcriptional activator [Rhizobium mesoamericanum]|nr:LysR family nod box-dependent transcriptional activator [Rhizobium mesoamericanum]
MRVVALLTGTPPMRFKGLDLNLLVAFDALMSEGNLTAAAKRINLSQPAMSAAVRRLRLFFKDDIFTPRGGKLVFTPLALALFPAVRNALQHIQQNIISGPSPCAQLRCRHFRIALCDFMTTVFLKRVIERVASEAPAVSFELLPLPDDPDQLLRRGRVDFVILPELFAASGHPQATLIEENLELVGCASNSKFSERMSIREYVGASHVTAKTGLGQPCSIEDNYLRRLGLQRRVDVIVPNLSMVPAAISGTERLAILPSRLVREVASSVPLRVIDHSIGLPRYDQAVQWPSLHDADAGSAWLRHIMLEEAKNLDEAWPRTEQAPGIGNRGHFLRR